MKKKIDTPSEQSSMSTESARRILFKEFGGKKAMKVLDRKEKMKVNVDVVKDQLDKTLMGTLKVLLSKHINEMKNIDFVFIFVKINK